ncbi:pyruvate dehydrogenase (acetyl-transferring) E1 component subunit alpha [Caldalkalibacillus salinus]|uniref:pyruvate dehydrogenase (acetyl-transferring) E1 component subunit alpha n=1 Tax=Caldalkalibacillus salinus TaxID=2803787 RepID=UPI001924E1D7|nr:pyruvate dehydrogenase (acetyl-transferring) E1 component subunit alpha [Caldalkalibacillus salinus]
MEAEFPVVQYISPEGQLNADYAQTYDRQHLMLSYENMLKARVFDRKAVNLQRQGRIGTYAPFEGQEAAQIGSAMALETSDWMFPSYRDHAATLTFGHSLMNVLLYWAGRVEGCMPPEGKHIFPPSVPIATQIPHAVGAAWAEKLKGRTGASIVYFGDGATSEGDFHEGLNFASVFHAPVVFFCQNNGFAISVPVSRQMKSKTIAQKALAYDIPSVRVDGNDVLAVYEETKKALDRARKGEGPTLIEAVTWRYGAHTTADDPTKYRDQSLSEEKRVEDPLTRVERMLRHNGDWDEEWAQRVSEEMSDRVDNAVKDMEQYPAAEPTFMFDHIFETPTWHIREQRDSIERKEG